MIGSSGASTGPGGKPSRLFTLAERYVALSRRHNALLLFGLVMLFGLALIPALRLELHTDLAELLPDSHPAVVAFRRISERQRGSTNLVVYVSSPDADADRRFAAALRPRLEALRPQLWSEIEWQPGDDVPAFAQRNKWLYAELKDLQNVEDLLDRAIARRASPLMVDLEDGDPEAELRALRERLSKELPKEEPPRESYETTLGGRHYLAAVLWRQREGLASSSDGTALKAVQDAVAQAQPQSFHAQMKVEYSGHLVEALEEQDSIREDLVVATCVCGSLVFLAIYLYFRRLALIFVIGVPAIVGTVLALALARFTIHFLNANTAFLISIILGNGINSPIVLLARYGEERKRDRAVEPALSIALTESFLGTIAAMVAASIAYGSLLSTSFRGFNQFGLIGGAGMLLVWTLTFLAVPPLVLLGERLLPGRLTPGTNLWRRPFLAVGRLAERRKGTLAIVSGVLILASLVPLGRYLRDPLEWNLNNLRSEEPSTKRLWPVQKEIGLRDLAADRSGNDAVLMVDRPEQAEPIAAKLLAQDKAQNPKPLVRQIITLSSLVPKDQAEKLEILGRLRARIDKHAAALDEGDRKEVLAWRPPETLRQLTVEDLPRKVREAFTEIDGTRGRFLGIRINYENYHPDDGHYLIRISRVLSVQDGDKTYVAAAGATIFAGMLQTIITDGPRVVTVALCGVLVLTLLAFGRGSLPVLLSLAIGLLWLGGLLGWLNVRLNFMNFVALPITLGVGTDYAANLWARLRREGVSRIAEIIADTGSAVALCSTTTIIGYSSLLLSRNRALRSFGLVADLGEVTCLLAAMLALPALCRLVRTGPGADAGLAQDPRERT